MIKIKPSFVSLILFCSAIVLFISVTTPPIFAIPRKGTVTEKEELSKIRVELDQTEQKLDSLREAESALLNKLSNLDQRIALDKDVIAKVTAKLATLRNQKIKAENSLSQKRNKLAGSKTAFNAQLQGLYLSSYAIPNTPHGLIGVPAVPTGYKELYFASLNERARSEITSAEARANSAQALLTGVKRSANQAEKLKQKRTLSSSIRKSQRIKSERTLGKVRQDKEVTADKLLYLSEEAKQMSELVARLESAERERAGSRSPVSVHSGLFVSRKGAFKSPIQGGKIISNFGWKTDGVTNLKSFAPGIEIQGKPNYNVRAIAAGV
ncbi:hypothetical protein JYT16_00620, partial [Gemmatimonas aurantiaca]|nr:hypothetical protein [Gemmatimonas aurantiaca]